MSAVTRIRTWVIAATTQCTNHYTITAVIPLTVEFKNGFRVKNKNKTKQTNKKNQTITTTKAAKNNNKRNKQKNKTINDNI